MPSEQEIREAVYSCLRNSIGGAHQLSDLIQQVNQALGGQYAEVNPLIRDDYRTILDILWELCAQGVVRPGQACDVNLQSSYPWFTVTTFGAKVLRGQHAPLPGDGDAYLARIDAEIHGLDAVVREYLAEALRCSLANCHKAATVMLGAASEQLVILLMESLERSPRFQAQGASMKRALKMNSIKDKQEKLVKAIQEIGPQHLSKEFLDDLDMWLGSFFNALRRSRNEIGHPKSVKSDPYEIQGLLIAFPRYVKTLWTLKELFDRP